MIGMLFSPHFHGAMPGASDEWLSAGFIVLSLIATWYILRGEKGDNSK